MTRRSICGNNVAQWGSSKQTITYRRTECGCKFNECALEVAKIFVAVQMLQFARSSVLRRSYHFQEGSIEFIRFREPEIDDAQMPARLQAHKFSADDYRRIKPPCGVPSNHGRRGCLSMSSGYGNTIISSA